MTQLISRSHSWLAALALVGGLYFTACGNDNSATDTEDLERPAEAENTAASNSTSHFQSSGANDVIPDSVRADSVYEE